MSYKGLDKLLNIGWGWMVLLVVVFPFIGFLAQLVFLFIELYSDNGFVPIPVMVFPVIGLMLVYFGWQYVVSIRLNQKHMEHPLKTKWFVICLVHILVCTFFMTALITFPSFFTQFGLFIDQWLYMVIELLSFLYFFSILAAYCYLCYFTSRVLTTLFKDKAKETMIFESLPYFMTVWVFPFGIPFFNRKIERHFKPKPRLTQNNAAVAFKPRTYDEY